jgi:CXXC-20-CXXC protein
MPWLRRHCPNCGRKVGWKRFVLKAWVWARWPCSECSLILRFDKRRRFLLAILMSLLIPLSVGAGAILKPYLGIHIIWVVPSVCVIVIIPILFLDAVTLA